MCSLYLLFFPLQNTAFQAFRFVTFLNQNVSCHLGALSRPAVHDDLLIFWQFDLACHLELAQRDVDRAWNLALLVGLSAIYQKNIVTFFLELFYCYFFCHGVFCLMARRPGSGHPPISAGRRSCLVMLQSEDIRMLCSKLLA